MVSVWFRFWHIIFKGILAGGFLWNFGLDRLEFHCALTVLGAIGSLDRRSGLLLCYDADEKQKFNQSFLLFAAPSVRFEVVLLVIQVLRKSKKSALQKKIIQHKIQKQRGKRWEIEVSASRMDPRQINDPPLFMKNPPLNKTFEVSRDQASVCLGNHLGVEATLLYHRLWHFRLHGTVLEMGLVVLDPVFHNWWRQGLRTLWTIWGFKLNIKHAHIPKWPTCLSNPNKNFLEILYKNTKKYVNKTIQTQNNQKNCCTHSSTKTSSYDIPPLESFSLTQSAEKVRSFLAGKKIHDKRRGKNNLKKPCLRARAHTHLVLIESVFATWGAIHGQHIWRTNGNKKSLFSVVLVVNAQRGLKWSRAHGLNGQCGLLRRGPQWIM